jgi:lycopene beta-cyclase
VTYLQFHLVFILPPLLLLALLRPWRRLRPGAWRFLLLLALIAFAYTTPWDNYLVARNVWGYGPERVMGTIGYVPVEEYLFFILQPFLTGLWLYLVMGRSGAEGRWRPGERRFRNAAGALAYLALALAGVVALRYQSGTYLGLILVWAAPVLAGQWAYAGERIAAHARAAIPGIAIPTLYLWFADATAIRLGIWHISERHIVGLNPLGLPVEEATFFLLTNVLIVQGLILFLDPPKGTSLPGSRIPITESRWTTTSS